MADRQAQGAGAEQTPDTPSDESRKLQGGYEGGGPEYGRGYGRDFGGGGRDQGFDGSWGQGYGGSLAPGDYREAYGGDDYSGGMAAGDYDRSFRGRGTDIASDERSWRDRCADDEHTGRSHHRGRGPKDWSRDDQRLYVEVCERLLHDRLIDARGIEVQVEDGVVSLAGEARGAADPALAERLVRGVAGVKDVRVDLRVNGALPRAPQDTASEGDDRSDRSSLGPPIVPR